MPYPERFLSFCLSLILALPLATSAQDQSKNKPTKEFQPGIVLDTSIRGQVFVKHLVPNTSASKSNLQIGDQLISIDGNPLFGRHASIKSDQPGIAKLLILRNHRFFDVEVNKDIWIPKDLTEPLREYLRNALAERNYRKEILAKLAIARGYRSPMKGLDPEISSFLKSAISDSTLRSGRRSPDTIFIVSALGQMEAEREMFQQSADRNHLRPTMSRLLEATSEPEKLPYSSACDLLVFIDSCRCTEENPPEAALLIKRSIEILTRGFADKEIPFNEYPSPFQRAALQWRRPGLSKEANIAAYLSALTARQYYDCKLEDAYQSATKCIALTRSTLPANSEELEGRLENLEKVARELGRYEVAISCLKEQLAIVKSTRKPAVLIEPAHWGWAARNVLQRLAYTYQRAGKIPEAVNTWNEYLHFPNIDKYSRAKINFGLALSCAQKGNQKEAEEIFEKNYKTLALSDRETILPFGALLCFRLKENDRALALCRELLTLRANKCENSINAESLASCGRIARDLKDDALARQLFDAALTNYKTMLTGSEMARTTEVIKAVRECREKQSVVVSERESLDPPKWFALVPSPKPRPDLFNAESLCLQMLESGSNFNY